MSEIGIATTGTRTDRKEPRKKKMTIMTISKRVDQRLNDFVNGVIDVGGGVVGHLGLHACRKILLDLFHLDANTLDHVHRIRVGQNPRCP